MQILKVEKISKAFGGLTAVKDLSFEIKGGEILGLIGPNGAGKTTVFNLLSGFYPTDGGSILFKGKEITGYKPHKICIMGLARTFQIVQPFPRMTAVENVMVGGFCKTGTAKDCLRDAEKILSFVGLDRKKNMLAEKLTLADRKCLELARALATGPSLLLLDEIMAGLVPTEWERMLGVIASIREKGITVFLIEHVMKAITKISDRIVVIHEGVKISEGKPEEVTRDEKVIKAYLGDHDEFTRGG